MKRIQWVSGAKVLLDDSLSIKSGEKVLIVGDSTTSEIVEFLTYLAAERGAEVTSTFMKPTGRHASEPPATVAAAMKAADVVIAVTEYSLAHSEARRQANAAGARIAAIAGADESLFSGGALEVDLRQISETIGKVNSMLKTGREVRITSESGTDIRFRLAGLDPVDQSGICDQPGRWTPLPDIETAVGPGEATGEGVWVVDGAVTQKVGVVKEPVRVTVSKGIVTAIDGGREAEALRQLLESYNDPSVYRVVEIGIGMNPKAVMERSYLESEAEYGTMHLGIGDGTSFGIPHRSPAHVDLVIRHPLLELDGRTILKDRKLYLD